MSEKIIVLGSCVSRVALLDGDRFGHGIPAENLEIRYYLERHNMVHAMMPPAFSREEVETVSADEICEKGRIHSLKQSLNKDTLRMILESDADYLIMDLMDFQTNFAIMGATAFNVCAYEFMNTALFRKYQDKITVSNFMLLPEWLYYPYIDLFFEKILQKFDADHIILNRFQSCTYYLGKDGRIKRIPDHFKNPFQANDRYNAPLRKLEDYMITKYDPYVIDLSKFYMGDENEWDNLQGSHFEREFYHETYETMLHIINDKPQKRVWDEPRFFSGKYKDIPIHLDIEDAFARLEQLVNAGDLLWMNILDKLYRIIPEDARVKEYVSVCMEEI